MSQSSSPFTKKRSSRSQNEGDFCLPEKVPFALSGRHPRRKQKGRGKHGHTALSPLDLQSRFFVEGKVVSVGSRERVGR